MRGLPDQAAARTVAADRGNVGSPRRHRNRTLPGPGLPPSLPERPPRKERGMTTRYAITDGIRVSVRPIYAPQHSDPVEPRHVFIYQIRIENVSDETMQLVWRHWFIHDEVAGESEVEGEGVVGVRYRSELYLARST
jgi:hypothetical protein